MLAPLAALQLLALAQAPAPAPADAPPPPAAQAPAPADAAAAPAPEAAPPAPPPATPPAAEPPAPAPAAPPEKAASPERPRQPSLVGAEPLRGGSAALAWAGWSTIGGAYAIGFSSQDDLGVQLEHDWAKSELHVGLLYRRPVAMAGSFDVGFRLLAAWIENLGSTFVYSDNHSDRGLELAPGVVLSTRAAGGLFAAGAEAPLVFTSKHKNGFLFVPRATLSFEAPLYPQVTVGARIGAGYRAGAGDAPLREGRGELLFLLLAGYQLL